MQSDRIPVLQELLRQVERVLDHQARRMEEQDDKTEQALALGVATLGGGLVLWTWIGGRDPASSAAFVIAGAAVLNLLALLVLLRAYVAVPVALNIGPHPRWVARRWREDGATLSEVLADLVEGGPPYYEQNANALIRITRERLRGLHILVAALSVYVISAGLMLLGA